MKKLIKILGGTLVALLLLLLVLPVAFKGKIEGIVKSEGNKLLNAQFDFKSLKISLLKNFPQASVSLHDFWLKGVEEFENDTLVYAGELTAAVNVMSLLGDGGFEVSKIIVDDTRVKAIVLEDGKVNWDVMKPSEEPEVEEEEVADESSSSLSISLKKLSVDDLSLIYDDRQAGMYAEVMDFDATCSGDMTAD
ncbi:MAG: AsmA family protein, partial [Alistipes sp.]|nr:AsmA family protein [Alistipes sp.]